MSNPTGKGGFQERKAQINRKGRPKSFDALRELALQIAHEEGKTKDGATGELRPVVIDGHIATTTELILRKWAASNDPRLQQLFIEIAFGKVPSSVQVSGADGKPLGIDITPTEWRAQREARLKQVGETLAAFDDAPV